MFFSHFMLFPTFLEKKSGNSFLYPLFLCSDFVSQMWGGLGGGGGCNVFITFYAISNISRKKSGNTNIKVPLHYSYWLNGRWFL